MHESFLLQRLRAALGVVPVLKSILACQRGQYLGDVDLRGGSTCRSNMMGLVNSCVGNHVLAGQLLPLTVVITSMVFMVKRLWAPRLK